jgi:hypothetical protein
LHGILKKVWQNRKNIVKYENARERKLLFLCNEDGTFGAKNHYGQPQICTARISYEMRYFI